MRFTHRLRLLAALALLSGICLLGAERNARAQGDAPRQDALRRTWIHASIGLAAFIRTDGGGFGALAGLSHQRGPSVFSARTATVAPLKGKDWYDAGMLYGRATSWSWGQASASVGAAYTWSEGTAGGDRTRTLGVPVQAQVYAAIPYLPLGVRLGGFANFNVERSFSGLTFGLVLGDLR